MTDSKRSLIGATSGGLRARFFLACGMLFGSAMFVRAADSSIAPVGQVRIVAQSAKKPWLELPRAAVVTDRDESGKRWEMSGELPAALDVARKDFGVSLNRQGWTLKQVTPTGLPGQRAELEKWTRGGKELLLMLSEDALGRSSFSVGRT